MNRVFTPSGAVVHRTQGHTALANLQAREAVAMLAIKIAVGREHRVLPIRRPQAQPAIVVMPLRSTCSMPSNAVIAKS